MAQLDSKKYTLGKTIADLEQDIASHEARLARTKSAAKEAESDDVRETDSGALDADMYVAVFLSLLWSVCTRTRADIDMAIE
jgi:septal ring factor EnvC (AmiA/AmiB activator)